ncbi:MAG: ergothioneine biosynthesis protein EgtB [Pseudomonadales bacterium]|nr:ergothioneine biosynthesis protein EgtB [Pseudomonadales bacterium]
MHHPAANEVSLDFDETPRLQQRYDAVRRRSEVICEPLATEDYVVQPMDDASPPKWHLAHVSWFFETFLLKPYLRGYRPFEPAYEYLFNSYYNGVGTPYPRPKRGHLSRPTVSEVLAYRHHVDEHMRALLDAPPEGEAHEIAFRVVLGCNHEQQHQELLYTDFKYNLGRNPLFPAYVDDNHDRTGPTPAATPGFVRHDRGIHEIGWNGPGFAFDNESPRHEVLVGDFGLANRPVTNGEYLEFIEDDGYSRPELWLSDAWSLLKDPVRGFSAPLYWLQHEGEWMEYHLNGGLQPLVHDAPVCHVSAYEADAYARWRGARLPTESEWEVAASGSPIQGNFVESGALRPVPDAGPGLVQLFGDVWEWTQSSYAPYPGFQSFSGALGEYNGKFMANQLVLRGGSCVTPASHIRPTYRNFFYPGDRWQFSGIRLAID